MKKTKQPSASSEKKIDVHCHLFNKEIASIPLLLSIIRTLFRSQGRRNENDLEAENSFIIFRIGKLLKMLFSSDEDAVLEYIQKYEDDTIFVPLMFDLKYAVNSKASFKELKKMNDQVRKYVNDAYKNGENDQFSQEEMQGFEALFNEIDSIVEKKLTASNKMFSRFSDDTFDKQYDHLLRLKGRHEGVIKPFFVVDSRREDVYDRMIEALEKDGFIGIKMYSPNGYSPMDPKLMKVYEYCQENQVPITVHCGYGGFATLERTVYVDGFIYKEGEGVVEHTGKLKFKKKIYKSGGIEERALALNHPDLWRKVLEKYPKLKLNLAHVGVRTTDDPSKKYEWSHLIIKMMQEYENLYTDLSCRTESETIAHLWDLAFKADNDCKVELKVTDRVMFGTDFWLSMLFIEMEKYMKNFDIAFEGKPEDFSRIQIDNPRRFLNVI